MINNFPQQNQQSQKPNPIINTQTFQQPVNQFIQINKNQQLGQNKPQMQFEQGNPQQFQFQSNQQNQQNLQNQKNIQPQIQGLNQNQGQQQFQNFSFIPQMNNNNINNNANNTANNNLPVLNNQNQQSNFQQNFNLKQQPIANIQNQNIKGDINQKPISQLSFIQNNQLQNGIFKQFETFNPKPPDLQSKFVPIMAPIQQPQMLPNNQQQKYQTVEVNNEEDRKQLVKNLNQYIKDGNPFFVFECLKQILQNDIRIKFPENLSNYK